MPAQKSEYRWPPGSAAMSSSGRLLRHVPGLSRGARLRCRSSASRACSSAAHDGRATSLDSKTASGDQLGPTASKRRIDTRMVEGAARPTRNLAVRQSAAFILITRAHGASQTSPSASTVPVASRHGRLYGSQKKLGTSSRNLGRPLLGSEAT